MKNLWPTNLFPLTLLGPGLRLSTLRRIVFSGRRDPVRINVTLPKENTVVFEDSLISQLTLEDVGNKIIPIESVNTLVNDNKNITQIRISSDKTLILTDDEKTKVTI